MKRNKKLLCLLLAATMLYISAPVQAAERIDADKNIGSVDAMKTEFAEDRVIVVLNQETSLKFDTYDYTDFSEIGCVKVTDLTADMGTIVKQKIEQTRTAEKAAAYEKTASDFNKELNVNSYKQILCLELSEPGKENVYETIKTLSQRPDVYCVNPDYRVHVESVASTNDYYYDEQWGLETCNFPAAWNLATSTDTVMVAVIDSGIEGDPEGSVDCHPDLLNRVAYFFNRDCFGSVQSGGLVDGNGHGTHVAGIIAAVGNNGIGICGAVGDNSVRLVSLRILDNFGHGNVSDLIHAISYASSLAIPIVNISTGYSMFESDELNELYGNSSNHEALYTIMSGYPGLFICSAGNNDGNTDSSNINHYPSEFDLDNIISVGAMTQAKTRQEKSNYGATTVDIFAPGENIISCYSRQACDFGCGSGNGNVHDEYGYHYCDGTSMAAPFVSAVAAMLKAQYPSLTPAQIKARILNNATQRSGLSCVSGGYLNAYAAMAG